MNEKGGMEGGGFEKFLEMQVYPAYPNLAPDWTFGFRANGDRYVVSGPVFGQVDAGPDRYSESSVESRIIAYQRGLILFPGMPNGTAANQVADDLFGVFKMSSRAVMDNIVGEKIVAKQSDDSVQVFGPARPPRDLRPFTPTPSPSPPLGVQTPNHMCSHLYACLHHVCRSSSTSVIWVAP